MSVPVVLIVAAAAILCGVVVVALGHGGELAHFAADVSPFEIQIATAADIALIRPPPALFGYNPQVTDDLLSAIARTVTDRDVEIAGLRQRLADLSGQHDMRGAAAWPGTDPGGLRAGIEPGEAGSAG